MPSLKEFVEALQSGWFTALVSAIGCSIIISGVHFNLPYLESTPQWLVTIAVTVGVFSISILLANIVYVPIAVGKAIMRRVRAREFRERVTKEVEACPLSEKQVLAYLITSGRRAFQAEINNPLLAPLVSKGILRKQGGTHHVLAWPYMVQEDVWNYLEQNKGRYQCEMPPEGHDPFHWRNTDY